MRRRVRRERKRTLLTKMADEATLHAVVHGYVQGVFFRQFVLGKAQDLGLKGYVCNLPDGRSVEVVAEGEREILEEFLRHLGQGPPDAAVQRVDARWTEWLRAYEDFRVA